MCSCAAAVKFRRFPWMARRAWDGWREKPSTNGRWFGWVPSLGPHLHVSVTTVRWFGSWMHAHKTLRHGMAWSPFPTKLFSFLAPILQDPQPHMGRLLSPPPPWLHRMDGCLCFVGHSNSLNHWPPRPIKVVLFWAPLVCGLQNTWIVLVANASGMGPKYYV